MTNLDNLLEDLDACLPARAWARGETLAEAWEQCDRADWLLWLCARMIGKKGWPSRKELVLACCDCAETALPYVAKREMRPRAAIEAARRWAYSKDTLQHVRAGTATANTAYAAYIYAATADTTGGKRAAYAGAAAAAAAYAATADTACAAAYAYAAADTATAAAHAAAYAAADTGPAAYAAAYAAAHAASLKRQAILVRKTLYYPKRKAGVE